jgi:hypothetical protein
MDLATTTMDLPPRWFFVVITIAVIVAIVLMMLIIHGPAYATDAPEPAWLKASWGVPAHGGW